METKVPLYVFDEHHEAFSFWHKARKEGGLPEALDLLHLDAHPDMSLPGPFSRSIYFREDSTDGYEDFYRKFALKELRIGNFILPAILTNVVRHVYFIFPEWRNFRPARRRMSIASVFGEGRILKQGIKAAGQLDAGVRKAYPDLKPFNYCMQQIHRIPKQRRVILDIDLDYFACVDSILNHISYSLEITPREFAYRKIFLAQPTLGFSGLHFTFFRRKGSYFARVAHRPGKEMAHRPPMEEIEREIVDLVATLRAKKIVPAVITICRSVISGFCPPRQARTIERKLFNHLRDWLTF